MIDLRFSVTGDYIPSDHNYKLFSAICSSCPVHNLSWQLGTIRGFKDGKGLIKLGQDSSFTIRCDEENITHFLALKDLTIGYYKVKVGIPIIHQIVASSSLLSRLVVVKNCQTEEGLTQHLGKKLTGESKISVLGRKTLWIKGRTIIGFTTRLDYLTQELSLSIQHSGLGGKLKLGCGFFDRIS